MTETSKVLQSHVELGVEMARKYGESALVINCIQAHHDDVPHETAESVLASLPPLVAWRYDWQPEPGSPEAVLYRDFLRPRDWLEPG